MSVTGFWKRFRANETPPDRLSAPMTDTQLEEGFTRVGWRLRDGYSWGDVREAMRGARRASDCLEEVKGLMVQFADYTIKDPKFFVGHLAPWKRPLEYGRHR